MSLGAERVTVGGADLQVRRLGQGPPLVFLHGEDGLLFCGPFLARLAEHFEVIAPSHPAWAGSTRPAHVRTLDDIAYLYLDLLQRQAVVGASGIQCRLWHRSRFGAGGRLYHGDAAARADLRQAIGTIVVCTS